MKGLGLFLLRLWAAIYELLTWMKQGFKTEWGTEDLCGCTRGPWPETLVQIVLGSWMAESSPSNSSAHYTSSPPSLSSVWTALKDPARMRKHPANFMNGHRTVGSQNKSREKTRWVNTAGFDGDWERQELTLNFRESDVIRWPGSDQDVIILIWGSLIAGGAGWWQGFHLVPAARSCQLI